MVVFNACDRQLFQTDLVTGFIIMYLREAVLTTESLSPPLAQLNALLLTLGSIHVECLAEDGLVAVTHTQIIHTIFYKALWRQH